LGIYFIPAGSSSRNREKSLDKGFSVSELEPYLPPDSYLLVKHHFEERVPVYAWGANRIGDLEKLLPGDFVVDMKNKEVVQIFQFAFWLKTNDTRLQDHIGWDSEKLVVDRRPYKYVYFLKSPRQTSKPNKAYYQSAFGLDANAQWLIGQRWFSDSAVQDARKRKRARSTAAFLGIGEIGAKNGLTIHEPEQKNVDASDSEPSSAGVQAEVFQKKPVAGRHPIWLLLIILVFKALKRLWRSE
jgi:hypothetical protein